MPCHARLPLTGLVLTRVDGDGRNAVGRGEGGAERLMIGDERLVTRGYGRRLVASLPGGTP